VEREHAPRALVRIANVPEYRLNARALVGERQQRSHPLNVRGKPIQVLPRLGVHLAQGVPFFLVSTTQTTYLSTKSM
jgi:hypothetical protein